ncbi:MAG: prepilin-type N-terminal cleavage/methylation domain-containing protein [Bdellovibrionales bacterium]|nr:type II secretion system GspH family protein [Bdellovibrionales bacterium]NQZ19769.1 prepilin-type N-terminal cleavage/methylation domain-containing protein [Bdellovibrionales bacterium]
MKKSRLGFTMIEVMVAMFIMSTLAVMVSRTIRASVNNKQKIETKIRYQTQLYDALRVLKMDIERAFHYQDVFFQIEEAAIQQLESSKKNNQQGQNGPGGNGAQPRQPPIKLTQFLGEENSLHFTSLNHFRTQYNAQESNQMEVGFYIDGCDARDGSGTTKCLWRRSSTVIDDRVDKDGKKVVVAEHVTNFKLAYRGDREEEDWVKLWRSDNKGRSEQRDKFPSQVKIDLEIKDDTNKKANAVKQTMVVNVIFPNNEQHLAPNNGGNNNNNNRGGTNP